MRKSLSINLTGVFVLLLTITPAFAIDESNRNLFLIAGMCLAPILLFIYRPKKGYIDVTLMLLGCLMLVIPLTVNPDTFRVSTVLYAWLFFLFFMAYTRVLEGRHYTRESFAHLLRMLIYAYFFVLLVQQFCVLTGLPIFNKAAYNPLEPWKLNALSPEPSHTARIISLLLFIYVKLVLLPYRNVSVKYAFTLIDRKVFYCYLYCIFTMGSSTGFLFLILLLSQFISKDYMFRHSLWLIVLSPVAYVVLTEIPAFQRAFSFLTMLVNYDQKALIEHDLSAAIRVIPTIQGFQSIEFFSFDGLWGRGIDADEGLTPLPSVECGAGAFSLWYNYGFLVSLLFWVFSYKICYIKDDKFVSVIIWVLLVFLYGGTNNPMIWLTLILMYTYNYFKEQGICRHKLY